MFDRKFSIFNRSVLLLLLAVLLSTAARSQDLKRFSYAELHMGLEVRVVLYAPDTAEARAAANAAYAEMARLNQVMSSYVTSSELMQLCDRAGEGPVTVSRDLFFVVQRAQTLAAISGGAFDITVGPYARLWREARRSGRLPDEDERARLDSLVGWKKVHLDPIRRTIALEAAGMCLDLGGIAKGYILDRAREVLKQEGADRALLEAGGDVVVSGPPPGREGWKIAIENAPEEREQLTLSHAAVASSGDTEQFVEIDGTRYSHIVDPHTGLGLTDRIAVTVVAPEGLTADGLATTISVLGAEDGRAFADQLPGVRVFIR